MDQSPPAGRGLCGYHALVLTGWRSCYPREERQDFLARIDDYATSCQTCLGHLPPIALSRSPDEPGAR